MYDPDRTLIKGWRHLGEKLEAIESMLGWVSPRLGIRFELEDGELQIYHPNSDFRLRLRQLR